jgi:arsenite/tail-anchored protein-transporting ATPase
MKRIILVSGKGGVGKTTVAAATGLSAARQGYRTLVLSFDLAHSLADSFDRDETLFPETKGLPVPIAENLHIQEIDVQEELDRHWKEIYRFSAGLMVGGGLQEIVADEVAIMPGMEDIVALIKLNDYVKRDEYDVIVLDCPPTSEALRFVSISTALDWYVRKRLKTDRRLTKLARPLVNLLSDSASLFLPDDEYFDTLEKIFESIKGIDDLLRDPKVTTVRLVTNAEKMVMRETQRAFMYFCMYGMTIDAVVINKIMPAEAGYFGAWAETQRTYVEEIASGFAPVPVSKCPMFPNEVCGLERLQAFARELYGDTDGARVMIDAPTLGFQKLSDDEYLLEIAMPFAPKDQINVLRQNEDLILRIGTFKRNILLPRAIQPLETAGANMKGGKLIVKFQRKSQPEADAAHV